MKLQFDSNQAYQEQALSALVDLFEGQPLNQGLNSRGEFTVEFHENTSTTQGSIMQTELGIGNNLVLTEEALYANCTRIQELNDIDPISQDVFLQHGKNFSIEMETGTGKTYVYLRTIMELARRYGFKKFIIVVPSVAIREGTLKNLEVTAEHFKALYNNIEYEYFVYDSKKANRLRQFALSNHIQIMVINIDAFRKDFSDSEDEKKSNVIFKENDKLSGLKPIEFVRATNPFVLIDEPQSVDSTDKAKEAIQSLNPLCIFRFSATHKHLYNLVYKLDPIHAYQLGLVKQIVVASVMSEDDHNAAYLKLKKVDNKKGIKATITIQAKTASGIEPKDMKVKQGDDIFTLSGEREMYRNGYEITEISAEPGNEYVEFSTHGKLRLGEERGGNRADIAEVQIEKTIKKHLDKELQLQGRGIKVLSLFFVDKVANYRVYNDTGYGNGIFAEIFERKYAELIARNEYEKVRERLAAYSVSQLHDGYFSQDKGKYKDTRGNTQADDDTYAKIMRNKEQLLSEEEPLRFIFSHSALREGWDNPNVFQICTLNETQSVTKKRQEIGRGLRLPVNANGERVFDTTINKLSVIANESYHDFAEALQKEYKEDCGVTFGEVPKLAFKGLVQTKDGVEHTFTRQDSEQLWAELQVKGFLDASGKLTQQFTPKKKDFSLGLSGEFSDMEKSVITLLQSYEIERHIKKEETSEALKYKSSKELREQYLDDHFEKLWERIKGKTTYQVEYSTQSLIEQCVKAIKDTKLMPQIKAVQIQYREASVAVVAKGVTTTETIAHSHAVAYTGGLPDIIGYLQTQTELTRSTIVAILNKCGRLKEFAQNPQKFMDNVATIIKGELHKLMIDGIKYEKLTVGETEWSMQLFRDKEILSYLSNRQDVKKSVYDAITYDSEIERQFAETLDNREDIKFFVKLPSWFRVETPVGEYNPDWAIVKQEDETLYLVRETKGVSYTAANAGKFRGSESDKIKCGQRHFEAIQTDFAVITTASEV